MATLFAVLNLLILFSQYFSDGKRLDIFNPKNLFQLYFIIQLPLVLVIGTNFNSPGFLVLSEHTDLYEVLPLALLFFTAQMIMVVCYYLWGRRTFAPPVLYGATWHYKRVKAICLLMGGVGYISFYYLLEINGGYVSFVEGRELWRTSGMRGQGWLLFPATTMLAIAGTAYVIAASQSFRVGGGLLKFIFLVAIVVFPATQLGFRGLMLLPVVQMMFVYHHRVQKINVSKAVFGMMILIVLFTTYGIYRELTYLLDDGADLSIVGGVLGERKELIYSIFLRSKGADIVANVIGQIGVSDFKLFYPGIIEAFTVFIPLDLWPNKPIPQGVQFSSEFFGLGGGVSATIIGEAYWNGGYLGVSLYMTLIGIVFRVYDNTVRYYGNKDSVLLILATMFPSLIMMAESPQGNVNGLVIIILFVSCLIFFFSLTLRRASRSG